MQRDIYTPVGSTDDRQRQITCASVFASGPRCGDHPIEDERVRLRTACGHDTPCTFYTSVTSSPATPALRRRGHERISGAAGNNLASGILMSCHAGDDPAPEIDRSLIHAPSRRYPLLCSTIASWIYVKKIDSRIEPTVVSRNRNITAGASIFALHRGVGLTTVYESSRLGADPETSRRAFFPGRA